MVKSCGIMAERNEMIMKKLLAMLLAVLLLPAFAMADETVTANAVAKSANVYQIIAPYSGVLKPFDWETGDVIGANEVLLEMETLKLYAPVDGTVRALFAQPGDQANDVLNQYGMLAAIEKDQPMIVNASTYGAYNKAENKLVHVGEYVYLEEESDRDNEGTGRIVSVRPDGYTVEVTGGDFDDNVSVDIYRSADCSSKSCIGSGRTDISVEMSVSGAGYVLSTEVQEGDIVQKGDVLYELASQDAENTLRSPELKAPAEGAVELAVISGMQVYKGQLLAKVHDLSAMNVVASVDEMDLDRAKIGDNVSIVFDRYSDIELHGTVTQISRIGVPKQNATYYDVTISIITNLEVLPGMNAVVTLK